MKDYVNEQNNDDFNRDFELSHIIGLNTNMEKCIQGHPSMPDSLIYSVGGIIVVEDLNDRNNQVYFRHGRNQIGAFKISNNGKFLAVGFVSDNLEKSIPTSVILWNFETKEVIYELSGVLKGVNIIEFSQDDQYIAAAGMDNSIYIWQLETGYKCFHRTFEFSINLLQWTYIFMTDSGNNDKNSNNKLDTPSNNGNNQANNRNFNNNNNDNSNNTEYYLTIANVNVIHYVRFYYDLNSMQYYTNFNKFNLPSTGYNRIYTSSLVDLENRTLFMGTSGGELSSFNLDNLYFKTSYNVINNGVTSLLFAPESNANSGNSHCVIIGGGDGRVKKMVFSEGKQILTHEIQLSSRILALAQGTDAREFYAATKNGEIFRVLADDFTYTLHSNSHVVSVNSAVYFRGRNDVCFVCDDLGNTILWDLNDFNVLLNIPPTNPNEAATSTTVGDDGTLFIGYSNGILRNYIISENNDNFSKAWEIPAHRGKISSIYVDGNYIVTGGEDGIVRIWTRKTHEMTIQFSAHHNNVFKVFADAKRPNLIHSCGKDKNLNCFDIKTQKRANIHSLKNGYITGITQKKSDPYEIISVGYNCSLALWDFNQTEPVAEMSLNQNLTCVEISNNGNFIAIGNEFGEILFFRSPDFEFLGKSTGHSKELNFLKWSPDDKQILSLSVDNSVCIWNFYKIISS